MRFGAAGLLGFIVPGAGHLFVEIDRIWNDVADLLGPVPEPIDGVR